jgi:hypothetical protein
MVEPVFGFSLSDADRGTAGHFFTVGLSGIGWSGPADPRIDRGSSDEPIDASLI